MNVRLIQDSPLSDWPGVEGLADYDKGNYFSVLYFAWAYILSARWVELLSRSSDHDYQLDYTIQELQHSTHPETAIEIHLGPDVSEDEVIWWRSILCSPDGWTATTKYNGHVHLSPWSILIKTIGLTPSKVYTAGVVSQPPSSDIALEYLSRFCIHYRLYAQCSVALTGVLFLLLLGGREICLPLPKPSAKSRFHERIDNCSISIPHILRKHGGLLPKYMTLSSNPWGQRALLCSTFFNPSIECNLVSAWLNAAFAVLNTISPTNKWSLAAFLANREPRFGILSLDAILTESATFFFILRDIWSGMVALDLSVSGWTGIHYTFLTSSVRESNGESISCEDECQLLFITACDGHNRPPVWPWKPFGTTKLHDAELPVQQHVRCAMHCLEYDSWEWILTNGRSI